jgi:hypothetical protein
VHHPELSYIAIVAVIRRSSAMSANEDASSVAAPQEQINGAVARATPPDLRASDRERDAVVERVQVAFAEGRIDDAEFDTRVRAALAARTHGDLLTLTEDLPSQDSFPLAGGQALSGRALPKPGRLSLAYKTSLRRGGRWRVPEKFTAVSYKGGGTVLDLRAAELTSAVTTIRVIAYKCHVQVIAPPGLRVEISGIGVSTSDAAVPAPVPVNAPIVHIRGLGYKGLVEVRSTPAG